MSTAATRTAGSGRRVAGSAPYPWPWNGDLGLVRTAVLMIDSVGAPQTGAWRTRADLIAAALSTGGAPALRVITRGGRRAGGGAGSRTPVARPGAPTMMSAGIDGFYGSALDSWLRDREIERIVLVGAWLETSVHSTLRSANDRGYECLLALDACLAWDEDLVAASASMVQMSGGIFGAVATTAAVLQAFTPSQTGDSA